MAETCEWCGRPFRGRARGFTLRWWHLLTVLLFGLVILAISALAFLNTSRLDLQSLRPRPAVDPSPAPVLEVTALPTRAATAGVVLNTPVTSASSPVARTSTPVPATATPTPARYVRIANTQGLGVFLRQEPGAQSERIQPALAEGAILRLVGPEQTVQAQIWRLCEHEGRRIQGWVAAQYLQSVDVTPTPTAR
ncbi:MAG TPA: hypothetical protein VHM16_02595 [Rubrobacteraceae bacterium]|nr:hypothetical protein [Rubrobacteraceae bacterium]